ncbi:MAG: hypothetical protein V4492_07720 [Chlamydiota bacterium]
MNLKHVDGKATLDGPQVHLGADERYFPVCYHCYVNELKSAQLEATTDVSQACSLSPSL